MNSIEITMLAIAFGAAIFAYSLQEQQKSK